ncbi:MAG: Hsp20/alpha crystallin family protein [Microscillaceae bacterium]|jgi:HSP20 family protein|nr:Hsp20/alpha crystallin family protein [Microscillaceae bacterium]
MKLNENVLAGLGREFDWLNVINGGITETSIDLFQNETGYEVIIFNPAFQEKNYHIEINGETVTVFATLTSIIEARERDKNNPIVPAFVHTFPIPNTVDANRIEAIFEDDELKIIAPFRRDIDRTSRKLNIKPII